MSIYTKKGDKGTTKLFDSRLTRGKRIPKNSSRVWAIGAIDELNSYLGVVNSYLENPETSSFVREIQKNLFTINSIIAGSKLSFTAYQTKKLENKIDEISASVPPLKNFIFPGGSVLASHFQYARALARRTERYVVALSRKEKVSPQILKYLNRLSDTLFMLAREANWNLRIKEELWQGKC